MRAAAVTKPEMSRRKFERFSGEDITRIRPGTARPREWVDSKLFVSGDLRFDQRRVGRRTSRIIAAAHVYFVFAEAALGWLRLNRRQRIRGFHFGHGTHV